MIAEGKVKRVGLLATQGIRGGANRGELKRIKGTGTIFWAQSDRDWIQDAEARRGMREALKGKLRYIATPRVAKQRVFVWLQAEVLANDGTAVIACNDDYSLHTHQKRAAAFSARPFFIPQSSSF